MYKTIGDYSKSIPKSPHFNKDNAKSIQFVRDSAYDGIAKAFGKFKSLAILKRPWLKDVTFKLSSLSKDANQEFTLDLDYSNHNPSCQTNVGFFICDNAIFFRFTNFGRRNFAKYLKNLYSKKYILAKFRISYFWKPSVLENVINQFVCLIIIHREVMGSFSSNISLILSTNSGWLK